ncbi:ABC transporter substrate-binding protein [Paracoccus alkenifer]|uniref:NitT/TauT family transport system substrate-binding protein n=1 Tax=Paracoccus alkenifer TaxID=65735 RepID=A0A1H6MCJ8_9RHOB|nr:ABC transporter substrate-binding protein [Paracoccus alkenifer]SEH95248.1 NitT/TauT family transport system substrate-binding protein [Paracoccus alkenifer]
MIPLRRIALSACLALGLSLPAAAQDTLPEITVGTLEGGTVTWELETIRAHGLDRAHGFTLKLLALAGNPATHVAMHGAEVDSIVSDWLWVAQQRAAGADYVFLPYSSAVGGLMVPGDSAVQSLADLEGQTIGVGGSPVDKSWLILRAWSISEHGQNGGRDLADTTRQVFGAAPIILNAFQTGEVAAAVNLWHFQAKMEARGARELVDVVTAARDLGLDPDTPLLGYVLRESWIQANPQAARGLAAASAEAKRILSTDDSAWDALRPIMNAENDAEFTALRERWRAGIPLGHGVDAQAAQQMFAVMAGLGGEELTGGLTELPSGLFWAPESEPNPDAKP